MYQDTTKIFGCVCPSCNNPQLISLDQFVLEKAIVCKKCKNIFCHWEGHRFPVTVHSDNQKISS